jgi:hypothetical protein
MSNTRDISQYAPEFANFLRACLPAKPVRITSGFGPRNVSGPDKKNGGHHAIDCSHEPGSPSGKYRVHCPFSGNIVGFLPKYNGILIDDGHGHIHGFLHLSSVVKKSGNVEVGSLLGHMGSTGAGNAVHLHYQIKPIGARSCIDPESFWAGKKQTFSVDTGSATAYDLGAATDEYHNQVEEQSGASTVSGFMPRQAASAVSSETGPAVWTNRVPQHEPWPRTLMGNNKDLNMPSDEHEYNTKHEPQLTDSSDAGSKLIGRLEGEIVIERGPLWRR